MDDFYGLLIDSLNALEGFRDDRPSAQADWERISYSVNTAVDYDEDVETDAYIDYDEIDFASWEARWDVEPNWTDTEEASDIIEMAAWEAIQDTDALNGWFEATQK